MSDLPVPLGEHTRIIYLAGPMRGLPEFNFPAFRAAREALRAQGHIVLCPAERDERDGFDPTGMTGHEDLTDLGFTLADALDACFGDVLMCDTIALLGGWKHSEGARAEALVANLTGRDVMYLSHYVSRGVEHWELVKLQIEVTTSVTSATTTQEPMA